MHNGCVVAVWVENNRWQEIPLPVEGVPLGGVGI